MNTTIQRAFAVMTLTLLAGVLAAQERSAREFGVANGGEVRMIAKAPKGLSATLGMTFSGNGVKGYEGTFGGTIAEDRMWFFGSAVRNEGTWFASPRFAEGLQSQALSGKIDASLGDRQTFSATAFQGRTSFIGTPTTNAFELPSSLLSLHYTGVVSNNMLFTASVSRSSTPEQTIP